ncbi:alpha-crystallin domain-containing protein 22.3-like [Tripterygium wilfordii]|uniref:alpha-crystallin domain-containing protein 22.3-like n=1 Tax=Tripterygium wilfordii TaxID=458696 RepID=UPI0018F811B2|nr:alpha-crystallin domain-containing protein 22.3-like [Tripterygium wilfordii]
MVSPTSYCCATEKLMNLRLFGSIREVRIYEMEKKKIPATIVTISKWNRKENFNCDTGPAAKIMIKGVTTTGEKTVCKNSRVFKMLTQNLSPLGYFSIVFHLAGPVDPQPCQGDGANGMLQCIVKKK